MNYEPQFIFIDSCDRILQSSGNGIIVWEGAELDSFSNIAVEVAGKRATITLARPEKRNPLDWETVRELRRAVAALEEVPALQVVVVTGSGDAFSAGGDLEKYLTLFRSAEDFRGFMEDFYQLFRGIERSSSIYVAAINGVCVAGGLELLMACDVVIASDAARIGDGHLNFGQLPGAGGSVRLWRAIGAHRAKHLMFTGDLLSAEECERIGLVSEVHPHGAFDAAIARLSDKLLAKSPVALAGAKRLLNNAIRDDLETSLRAEIEFVQNYATTEPDPIEGLMAFKEKRKPKYKDRT